MIVLAVAWVLTATAASSLALTRPTATAADPSPVETALAHLEANRSIVGLNPSDLAGLEVTDVIGTASGASVVHLRQTVSGIDVIAGTIHVVVDASGRVRRVVGEPVTGATKLAPSSLSPRTDASAAARTAAVSLGLRPDSELESRRVEPGPERSQRLDDGGIAAAEIPARLVLVEADGRITLAWELLIEERVGDAVWQIHIDAETGAEIARKNLTSADSYNVHAQPVQAPSFGDRTTVADPADPLASPFGWHDTDGVVGAEFTTTQGNNVSAYADTDADQQPDAGRPDGGPALVFDAPLDLSKEPADSKDAAIINLFYWANVMHDVTAAHGFDAAAGNFQSNNYGNGGLAGDALRAEAQDGFTTNNANFYTPPDGSPPRLQLYLFTGTTPARDSSLDASLIAHEYTHGVTERLTGGPASVACLQNEEQPGEGWSDWMSLMMTMRPGDAGSTPRGLGTYVLGQPTTGAGIRGAPYSTDANVDGRTYSTIVTAAIPHGVGSVFTSMLWDMTWALIDRDGFDPDLAQGTGGNNVALALVIDALKLQPCSPGFVDARDALLLADELQNGAANECVIWESFAQRGLGVGAVQGDTDNRADGIEDFSVPPACSDLTLAASALPAEPLPGDEVTFTVQATNNSLAALTGVSVTAGVPGGSTYVPSSATCGGTEAGGVVTLTPGTIGAGMTVMCDFAVAANPGPGSVSLFVDGAEAGLGSWTATNGAGSLDWTTSNSDANTGTWSFQATAPSALSDQYLATTDPIAVSTNTELRFWHLHNVENTWDGGVVEVSTNGADWTDAGPLMASGGYSDRLRASTNPLGGRLAFTGNSGGWNETVVDLASFAGQALQVRFRLGTDSTIAGPGWFVDDVSITDSVVLENQFDAVSSEGAQADTSLSVTVAAPSPPGLLRVTTNPAVPSVIEVDGLWTDAFGLDWVEIAAGTHDVCFPGVPGFVPPPCEPAVVVPGMTTVVQGDFQVQGTLDIVTSPAVASTITVDGAPVNDWGAIVRIAAGNPEVCFGAVVGWDPPPCTTQPVTAGSVTPVTGTFVANGAATGPTGFGNLRVTTSPAVSAQISIDGVGAQSFGLDWVKVAPGPHQICFSDVPGYETPPCETVTVVDGATTVTTGLFTQLGELRVITSPPADQPVTVDGRVIDQYGFWTWAPAATYEICTVGYTCQNVVVVAGNSTTVTLTPP